MLGKLPGIWIIRLIVIGAWMLGLSLGTAMGTLLIKQIIQAGVELGEARVVRPGEGDYDKSV